MTTQLPIPKERLEQISSFSKGMVLPPSHDEIEVMARALLAAYEQEPVAWITWHQGFRAPDDCEDYLNAYTYATEDKSCDGTDAIPVYAAPPSTPAPSYGNIKAIESAIAALKRTITEARRFRYCLGALMNLDDEVAKLKALTHVPAPSIPAVPDEISTTEMKIMNGRVITMSVHTEYKNCWNACRAAMLNGGKS